MLSPDPLDTPLTELDWAKKPLLLGRLGIHTWRELLHHFPRRYEDRSRFAKFPTEATDHPVCVRGMITKVSARYFGRRKIVEVTLEETSPTALSGRLICRWFNQHYVQKMLAEGLEMIVFGRPKEQRSRIILDHPEFEIVEEDGEQRIHVDRIAPIYPLTEGIRQRALRTQIYHGIEALTGLPDQPIFSDASLPLSLHGALRQIHFPSSMADLEAARRELALAELLFMMVIVEHRRLQVIAQPGEIHASAGRLLKRFLENLPFKTTAAQQRAITEIRADLQATKPMNRLLQGDVGAGKTVVAVAAMLDVVEAGFQSVLMAPTQVLAEQHFRNLSEWLIPLGVKLALRTASRRESSSMLELEGPPDIIVGTHALLFDDQELRSPGLVVIDEQHKFGVLQRAKLVRRTPVPDLLVMTATPIPRTLAMTVYGDLDISVLDEKPADRKPVITGVRSADKVPEAAAFIKERIAGGRQVYIIYPVIEESETLSVKAATTEFEKWKEILAPAKCGLLHGRLDGERKEEVMEEFRKGELQVLVSTSVIEVGVDVPNATVMLIENSERFGLAQLHQLRGRIGRGRHQSYCILMTETADPEALEKLSVLERTEDGFEIAEADLQLRGPGDIVGLAQSGLPPLRLANLLTDGDLVQKAKVAAQKILKDDPSLIQPENRRLQSLVVQSGKNGSSLAN